MHSAGTNYGTRQWSPETTGRKTSRRRFPCLFTGQARNLHTRDLRPSSSWISPPRKAGFALVWAISDRNIKQVLSSFESQEEVYAHLAARVAAAADVALEERRTIVGVVGIPGSGKSTTAAAVCRLLNEQIPDMAVVLPMDGFHFYRWQLDAGIAGAPAAAHARRGAHWTFDAEAFLRCVRAVREAPVGPGAAAAGVGAEAGIPVPTFAHGVGDPAKGGSTVMPYHKIVLVEGNYLLLDKVPWSGLLTLLDDSWYIDCEMEVAMRRVERRHIETGKDMEAASQRVATNDRPNAELIQGTRCQARLIVPSLDEPTQKQ